MANRRLSSVRGVLRAGRPAATDLRQKPQPERVGPESSALEWLPAGIDPTPARPALEPAATPDARSRWMMFVEDAGRGRDAWTAGDQPRPGSWTVGPEVEPEAKPPTAAATEARPSWSPPDVQAAAPAKPVNDWTPRTEPEPEPVTEPEAVTEQEPEPEPLATPSDAEVFAASRGRTRAVEAYCAEACAPTVAAAAAAETLGTFVGGDEHALLRLTRSVAAKYATLEPERRGWRGHLSAERRRDCEATQLLLASRANDMLDDEGARQLDEHIKGCRACEARVTRSERAERAFGEALGIGAGAGATAAISVEAAPTPAAEPVAEREPEPVAEAEPVGATEPIAEPEPVAEPEPEPVGATATLPPLLPPPSESDPARPRHRRRAGLAIGVAAIAAAAVVAVALATGSSNTQRQVVANVTTPTTPITTAAATHHHTAAPVKHVKHKAAAKPHHAGAKASTATSTLPASVHVTASVNASPTAPAHPVSSEPTESSSPASSGASSPSTASSNSNSSPPSPSASISQPSLPAANAPQGLGH